MGSRVSVYIAASFYDKRFTYLGSDINVITDHLSHPAGFMGASLCYTAWKIENYAQTLHTCTLN